jgi:predicted nucleic acid-binding protein
MPEFSSRILSIPATVARRSAVLHVPGPRSQRNALIAAPALVHAMTVVTHNIADFDTTGVRLVNP